MALAKRLRIPDAALTAIAGIAVAGYAAAAMHQVGYWKNSETLFTHTLAVTRDNSTAEYMLGQTLQATKPDPAILHLRRAIDLTQPLLQIQDATTPDWYSQAYVGIGTAHQLRQGAGDRSECGTREKQYRRCHADAPYGVPDVDATSV